MSSPRRRQSNRPSPTTRGKVSPPQKAGSESLGQGVLIAAVLGIVLTWVFWWPLWKGGGLIGGDLFAYYFPQKGVLADSLKHGVLPLWNPLVGFGYPILGESQTAALYPPNLILYSLFSINSAYHISQLGHYLLTFIGAFLLARRLELRTPGALLASLTLVYGWFPPRICHEWAIIGGAWFVWILYFAAGYLQTGRKRNLLLVSICICMDLMAGHYHLAWITLLVLLALPRLVPQQSDSSSGASPETSPSHTLTSFFFRSYCTPRSLWLAGAVGIGFVMASIQLLPTLELKGRSQRQTVNEHFSPTYGHLPPLAISQMWMPWAWYAGEQPTDELLSNSKFLSVPSATNQVEAQFYLGLFPLMLSVAGLLIPGLRRTLAISVPWRWGLLIAISLVLASGWPSYLMPWMPGLNYFRGPGRYTLIAALSIAILSGATLDAILRKRQWGTGSQLVAISVLLLLTTIDLWAASRKYQFGVSPYWGRNVFYTVLLDQSPLAFRENSPLAEYLHKEGIGTRLYAPGANVPTLLGISALPVYLGLGPEIYESDAMKVDFSATDPAVIEEILQRLKDFGVTHLLLETPLDESLWPVDSRGMWTDPLLNSALARRDPYYLYALRNAPGRVSLEPGEEAGNRIVRQTITPNRITIEVECQSDCTLILRDLDYPGWNLHNRELVQKPYQTHFRSVALKRGSDSSPTIQKVEWVYFPRSVLAGGILSVLGGVILVVIWWKGPKFHPAEHNSQQERLSESTTMTQNQEDH